MGLLIAHPEIILPNRKIIFTELELIFILQTNGLESLKIIFFFKLENDSNPVSFSANCVKQSWMSVVIFVNVKIEIKVRVLLKIKHWLKRLMNHYVEYV